MNVSNKVCVVTGSVGGIGQALARSLLRRSALVCLVDVAHDGDEVARRLAAEHGRPDRCVYVRADCTKVAELEAAYKAASARFGGKPVKVMWNNAALGPRGINERVELTVALNFTAVVHGTRIAFEDMSTTGGGCVVNTASVAGLWPAPKMELYSATKGAVTFLTRALKTTCPEGVRVNALCPYAVDTPLIDDLMSRDELPEGMPPMRPEHVAEASMALIEEPLHGECLVVLPEESFLAQVRVTPRKGSTRPAATASKL